MGFINGAGQRMILFMPNEICECLSNFTCGYCLRNAKPWFWTPSKAFEEPELSEGLSQYEQDLEFYEKYGKAPEFGPRFPYGQ